MATFQDQLLEWMQRQGRGEAPFGPPPPETEPPAAPAAIPPPQPVSPPPQPLSPQIGATQDFLREYGPEELDKALAEDRRRAVLGGLGSDFRRASYLITGVPHAERAVPSAMKEWLLKRQVAGEGLKQRADLEAMDPNSPTSQAMFRVLNRLNPALAEEARGLSAAQIARVFPETKAIMEEAGRSARAGAEEAGRASRSEAELGVRQSEGLAGREAEAARQRAGFQAARDLERLKAELAQKTPKAAGELRDKFLGLQTVKDTQQVATAYEKIKAASATGAGDISLVYGYMKLLDPGSTVREGEFATAANAGSVPSKVVALYNQALKGEKLPPEVRAQFKSEAGRVFAAQMRRYDPVAAEYRRLAEQQGVSPEDVVLDLGLGGGRAETAPGRERKEVGGNTYEKINGEWYEAE